MNYGEEKHTKVQVPLRDISGVQPGPEEQRSRHKCQEADLPRAEDVQKPTRSCPVKHLVATPTAERSHARSSSLEAHHTNDPF